MMGALSGYFGLLLMAALIVGSRGEAGIWIAVFGTMQIVLARPDICGPTALGVALVMNSGPGC